MSTFSNVIAHISSISYILTQNFFPRNTHNSYITKISDIKPILVNFTERVPLIPLSWCSFSFSGSKGLNGTSWSLMSPRNFCSIRRSHKYRAKRTKTKSKWQCGQRAKFQRVIFKKLWYVCTYLHYKIQKLNLFEITAHDFCAVITLFDHTGLSGVFCNISTCICGIQCWFFLLTSFCQTARRLLLVALT